MKYQNVEDICDTDTCSSCMTGIETCNIGNKAKGNPRLFKSGK
jgi:hypothetical protein